MRATLAVVQGWHVHVDISRSGGGAVQGVTVPAWLRPTVCEEHLREALRCEHWQCAAERPCRPHLSACLRCQWLHGDGARQPSRLSSHFPIRCVPSCLLKALRSP
eukprot:353618-Chlamydomonas_euryale.AAC.14